MKRKYQSELLKVCHQEAENLLAVGAISEAEMREYDRDCLVQEPEAAKETAETMEMEHISPVAAGI
jgi:DNA-binding transcriptional regulator YiaG